VRGLDVRQKGMIIVPAKGLSEDEVMEVAIDSGAEDVAPEGDTFEIMTGISDFENVRKRLKEKGGKSN